MTVNKALNTTQRKRNVLIKWKVNVIQTPAVNIRNVLFSISLFVKKINVKLDTNGIKQINVVKTKQKVNAIHLLIVSLVPVMFQINLNVNLQIVRKATFKISLRKDVSMD